MTLMKKILSVLLVIMMVMGVGVCATVGASAAGTDITDKFTDSNFRAAVYETIGKAAPEPILDTDVAGITILEVEGKNILSLAGLEHFTDLVTLNCSNTSLQYFPICLLA